MRCCGSMMVQWFEPIFRIPLIVRMCLGRCRLLYRADVEIGDCVIDYDTCTQHAGCVRPTVKMQLQDSFASLCHPAFEPYFSSSPVKESGKGWDEVERPCLLSYSYFSSIIPSQQSSSSATVVMISIVSEFSVAASRMPLSHSMHAMQRSLPFPFRPKGHLYPFA